MHFAMRMRSEKEVYKTTIPSEHRDADAFHPPMSARERGLVYVAEPTQAAAAAAFSTLDGDEGETVAPPPPQRR